MYQCDPCSLPRVPDLPMTCSKAPCYHCSRKLQDFKGVAILVDGNKVMLHKSCLGEIWLDDDFKGRVEVIINGQ